MYKESTMKKYLLGCICVLAVQYGFSQTSIYQQTLPAVAGDSVITMERFRGKTILLVNAASAKDSLGQFTALRQLYTELAAEGLVVIICPSNSFGNEPGDDIAVKNVYPQIQDSCFIITKKINVAGEEVHSLYDWLADKEKNGVMKAKIKKDWTKILINPSGQLAGYFSQEVLPSATVILNAIRQ